MANGMCQHNNLGSYCPSCLNLGRMPSRRREMGAYELIKGSGIWIPDSGDLLQSAGQGALSDLTKQLATSSGVQQAAVNSAGESLGIKIVRFYKEKPMIAYGVTALAAFLLFQGSKTILAK